MKFIVAALAAVAYAEQVAEAPFVPFEFMPTGGSPVDFVQTDAMLYFMMDPTLTYTIPDVPDKGITLIFCIGGIFFL